jgi:hypothetical protein
MSLSPPQEVRRRCAPVSPDPSTLSRDEALALVGGLVSVVAVQQQQIHELRDQVATLHNQHLAVFGEQKVIEQLTNAARDFEGVDVTMKLEEASSSSSESAIAASEASDHSLETARDATAAIEGIASLVVGLNAGGEANLSDMNRRTRKLSERSKQQMKVRSRGEVRIKFAKVSGGHTRGDS